jgi:hypothetical protein
MDRGGAVGSAQGLRMMGGGVSGVFFEGLLSIGPSGRLSRFQSSVLDGTPDEVPLLPRLVRSAIGMERPPTGLLGHTRSPATEAEARGTLPTFASVPAEGIPGSERPR